MIQNSKTILDILNWRAIHQSDKIAFTYLVDGELDQQTITYAELVTKSKALAASLQEQNLANQRAVLLYPSGIEFIIAFFGCLYAKAVAVPVYPPHPMRFEAEWQKVSSIMKNAQTKIVLTQALVVGFIQHTKFDDESIQESNWLATDTVSDEYAAKYQATDIGRTELAYLQYTSGSTSEPKGVMIEHQHIVANAKLADEMIELSEQIVSVSWLPLYHDLGLLGFIITPIFKGYHSVLLSPLHFLQKPVRWLQAITRFKADRTASPNFGYELCIKKVTEDELKEINLSHLKISGNGGEPTRWDTMSKFLEKFSQTGLNKHALYPGYGMAEAVVFMVSARKLREQSIVYHVNAEKLQNNRIEIVALNHPQAKSVTTCGTTGRNHQIKIVDPNTLSPCDNDQVGEIWFAGPSVASGYWQNEEDSGVIFKAKLPDDSTNWLRTGDIGCLIDGNLIVTGRLKDLIIVRGRNYYPQDIELLAERSDPVLRTGCGAAFSIEVNNEEQIVIVQEVIKNSVINEEDVFKKIKQTFSINFDIQPTKVILIQHGTIPKTSSGKIQRHLTRQKHLDNKLEVVASWIAPQVG